MITVLVGIAMFYAGIGVMAVVCSNGNGRETQWDDPPVTVDRAAPRAVTRIARTRIEGGAR